MRQIRKLLSDYLLVRVEPAVTHAGCIVLPDPEAEPIRTGEVIMAGPGRHYSDKFVPVPDDIVGKRVAFMMAATQTGSGRAVQQALELDKDHVLIRMGDVLLDVDIGVEVSR